MLQKEAFKQLFDLYFDDVRRYIFYRCGNDELATDIAQDTFLRIWEKKITVEHKTAKALLFKIASDLFVSSYRKEKAGFNFFNTFVPNEKNRTPEDDINYKQLSKAYEKALKSMPEKQRVAFLMSRIEELKYKEIALQLGVSIKTVEKYMSLALEHLRVNLKDHIEHLVLFILNTFVKRHKN
jgi:RNA polymerase sigma-70 factor (ECF subfamily)